MLIFDTHSHLNFDDFKNEQKKIIEKNLKNNLWTINVGTEKESSQKAIELANKYHEGIYASVGIHPIHSFPTIKKEWERKVEKFDYDFYFDLIKNKKVVAIGEVGLDYHHFEEGQDIEKIKKLQKEIFLKFLNLTLKTDKALIIHCWEAYDDLLAIIENFIIEKKWEKKNKGIIHSFNKTNCIYQLLVGFNGRGIKEYYCIRSGR
jgi:TatD DNase family protein